MSDALLERLRDLLAQIQEWTLAGPGDPDYDRGYEMGRAAARRALSR